MVCLWGAGSLWPMCVTLHPKQQPHVRIHVDTHFLNFLQIYCGHEIPSKHKHRFLNISNLFAKSFWKYQDEGSSLWSSCSLYVHLPFLRVLTGDFTITIASWFACRSCILYSLDAVPASNYKLGLNSWCAYWQLVAEKKKTLPIYLGSPFQSTLHSCQIQHKLTQKWDVEVFEKFQLKSCWNCKNFT
jgi:hypothetical protein